jgi:hypothetical protein
MVDNGLASATSSTDFFRTVTSLNTADYDGSVSYYFEFVATNTGASSANLHLKSAGGYSNSYSIPAGVTSPTRYQGTFSPSVASDRYYLRLDATSGAGDVKVYHARMKVRQVGATKTRIYIPMVGSAYNSTSSSDSSGDVANIASSSYQNLSTNAAYWKKNNSNFATIATGTPWTFEAVLTTNDSSKEAFAALFNKATGNRIAESEISTAATSLTSAAGTGSFQSASFADSSANFTDLGEFEVRIKNASGGRTTSIYRAGLWLRLSNLSKGEVYYRASRGIGTSATLIHDYQRSLFEATSFSNPTVYFEIVGSNTLSSSSCELFNGGVNDSGTGGAVLVGSSSLNFGTSKALSRSSALSLTSGDRYMSRVNYASGLVTLIHSLIVVGFE